MEKLSAVSDGVANLPLRPLLFATGAAAMAASIYFYVKRDNDGKRMIVDPKGPVYDQAREPALVQLTEVLQDQMTEAIAEANEKIQKFVVFNTQLENRVRELEELLSEAHRDMQSKVSLAGAKGAYKNSMETIAQLEAEMFILTNQVDTLKDTVKEIGSQLCGTYRECEELNNKCEQERKAHSILQAENNELKETLNQQQELHNVFQTEAENNQMAMQTIAKLEKEKYDLTNQVKTLRDAIKGIGNQLYDTHRECNVLIKEHRQEQEAYSILQAENDELKKTIQLMKREKLMKACEQELTAHSTLKMDKDETKKTLSHKQESVKTTTIIVSLAGAKEKCQKAVDTIAQLQTEKSLLTNKEHEHELKGNSTLKVEKDKMKITTTAIVCVCVCVFACVFLCVCVYIYIYLFPHILGTFCPFYP